MKLVNWLVPVFSGTVAKIRISRAPMREGTYEQVALFDAYSTPTDSTTFITEYRDEGGEDRDWYLITFVGPDGSDIASVGPHPGQTIHNSQYELLFRLRHKISDTKVPYVFSDWELLEELDQALLTHSPRKTWEDLNDQVPINQSELLLILWLAVSQVAKILATDNAKYFPLSIDGKSVDKTVRVEQYLRISQEYLEQYTIKKAEWNLGLVERSGEIHETYMTRQSLTTGRRTPFTQANPPDNIIMYPPTHLNPTTVDLAWSKCNDPEFYYYIIFRSREPNVQTRLIRDAYNKRISLHDDPIDYQTNYLWGGVTVPIIQIFRNSTTNWIDQQSNVQFPQQPFQRLYPGETYYYVVVAVNRNLLFSISNEIKVTLPPLKAPTIMAPVLAYEQSVVVKGTTGASVNLEKQAGGIGPWVPFGSLTITGTFADTVRFTGVNLQPLDALRANMTYSIPGFTPIVTEYSTTVVVQ